MPSVVLAPPNSLVVVWDSSLAEIPDTLEKKSITHTSSSVWIGTLAFMDGATRITLDAGLDHPVQRPAFDEVLKTPSKKLSVSTVYNETLMELGLATERTRVRIWVNHTSEPDDIRVVATPVP